LRNSHIERNILKWYNEGKTDKDLDSTTRKYLEDKYGAGFLDFGMQDNLKRAAERKTLLESAKNKTYYALTDEEKEALKADRGTLGNLWDKVWKDEREL